MQLPHGNDAIIDQRKLTDYCLSPDHDAGKHKAQLFRVLLGLTRKHAGILLDALRVAAWTVRLHWGMRTDTDSGMSLILSFKDLLAKQRFDPPGSFGPMRPCHAW
jgi:hypothetical protein